VIEEIFHGVAEVREVTLDFDEVLVGAVGAEKVVVMLDPLEFVADDDRAAELAVFEGARVRAA
jgi:hypothetical protein